MLKTCPDCGSNTFKTHDSTNSMECLECGTFYNDYDMMDQAHEEQEYKLDNN